MLSSASRRFGTARNVGDTLRIQPTDSGHNEKPKASYFRVSPPLLLLAGLSLRSFNLNAFDNIAR